MLRPVHAVNQQDVLPAIAVIVQEGATGAQSFGQQFASIGAAVVKKPDSRLIGDIDQAKRKARRRLQGQKLRRGEPCSNDSLNEAPAIHRSFTRPARMA